jgi:hypothetical protein
MLLLRLGCPRHHLSLLADTSLLPTTAEAVLANN